MLTIVAHTFANPGDEEAVFAALKALVAPTRQEAGCVLYDLHRDDQDATHFMFYETWESREAWLAHMEAAHIATARAATAEKVARRELYEMTRAE